MKLHFDSNRFNITDTDKEILETLLFSWPILFLNIFVWSFLVAIISFFYHNSIIFSFAIFCTCFVVGAIIFKYIIKWLEG